MHVGRPGAPAQLGAQPREQAAHLGRVRHAGGVGQADLVHASLRAGHRQTDHLVFVHRTLQRAAECGGQPHLHRHAGRTLAPQREHLAQLAQHLFARLAHIGQRMRLAGRHWQGELVHARGQRRLGATPIGHQGHHGEAGVRSGEGERVPHHLGHVGHLRQQLRWHEGADLDLAQAGGSQRGYPAAFVDRGHGGADRLQAVARADLADQHLGPRGGVVGQCHEEACVL
ncbi:hypothetical protein D9M69_528750 [compost metagenome]